MRQEEELPTNNVRNHGATASCQRKCYNFLSYLFF